MQQSTENQERILQYASLTFFREGFSKVSIDQLTADLSMSKKTFYQVFRSKDHLVEELMKRRLAEVNRAMDEIFSREADAVTKLHDMVKFLAGMLSGISKIAMTDIQRQYPQLWTRMQQFRRERLARNLTMILEQGIIEGQVRPDVSKRIFILSYISSVEGVIQPEVLAEESFSSREAIEEIVNIFFGGILTEAARVRFQALSQSSSTQS